MNFNRKFELVTRDIEDLLDDLVDLAWPKDELTWTSKFYLKPSDLANSQTIEQVVRVLLSHVRQISPRFAVPDIFPRVVVKSMSAGVDGRFVVDEKGWVTIAISPDFSNDRPAAMAILAHEVCHYILDNRRVSHPDPELNDRYTDLFMFVCGFSQIFLAGYQPDSVQNEYRHGHLMGHFSSAEYQFIDRYVGNLRTYHRRKLISALTSLRQQLLQLNRNDTDLIDCLIEYEYNRSSTKSEVSVYQAAIDRLLRDRRARHLEFNLEESYKS